MATEIYVISPCPISSKLDEVFKVKKTISYDLRMRNELYARNPKTVRYSIETISFLSPKNWAFIPKKKKTGKRYAL